MGFDDDEARWEIRAAYADIGLSRGEQVMLFTDPATTAALAAQRLRGWVPAEAAVADGRLIVVNKAPGYDPVIGFDPAERAQTWVQVTNRARSQGFSGVRAVGDMSWAAGPGIDHDLLVAYEDRLTRLFADIGFTAICEYDRRRFDEELVRRICVAHPRRVLDRLGALDVTGTDAGLRIAGDADLATREEFGSALALALASPDQPVALDLSELCFIDAYSAAQLVRLAARIPRDAFLEVHCRPPQGKVIRLCGAAQVPQLILHDGGPA